MPRVEQVKYRNGHRYRVIGDERVDETTLLPSCTGIAQYANKSGGDGLLYWAVNLYQDSGNRTEFLNEGERSREIGTKLHAEIEEYISTDEMPLNHSDLFGAWYSSVNEKGVEFYTTEKPVYHPYLLYGGTLDAIGYVDGVPTLFDWKTTDEYRIIRDKEGKTVFTKDGSVKKQRKKFDDNVGYAIQIGGYMAALKMMAQREDIVVPEQAYIVYIFKDTNTVHWEKVNLDGAERVFASCANLDNSINYEGGLYA